MTRQEQFKTAPIEEVAQALCDMIGDYAWTMEEIADDLAVFPHQCKACPAYKSCKPGHNGFIDWLQEEADA